MRNIRTLGWMAAALLLLLSATVMASGMDGNGCKYCGMNLEKFAHTAMKIHYDDGSEVAVCSLHCAAVDMALNIDKAPVEITVGDFNSREQVNAEQAFWVIDDNNPGVMTARAKWAFVEEAAAAKYQAEKGGRMAGFEEAIKSAYEDMYKDTLMIRNKRKMKKMKAM